MPLVINGRFLTRPTTGVERYARALLPLIARRWPDSRIIVPRASGPVDNAGLEVVHQGIGSGHWWEQSALPAALRKGDVLLSPANTGPLRVRRQVLVLHDLAFLHDAEWFDRRFVAWYGFLLPRLVRRCARVIAVSPTMQAEVARTFALPPERITTVPAFPNVAPVNGRPEALPARPYLLLVGAHDPRKRADQVLAWYRQLHAPPFDLVLVGRMHRAFAAVPLYPLHNVHVLGEVDDATLAALYAHALALVHASVYEGFGLPVLEAMALGCPVIAHELPVLRDLFGDAPCYADPADPPAMEAALAQVTIPGTRAQRIAQGRAQAAAFSADRTAQALHAALDPLLR